MSRICRLNQRTVTVVGSRGIQGSYLLRLTVQTPISLAFGRFAGGREFTLPTGDYLYVGSAMGLRGATTLASRLLRHATRSGEQPAHTIRDQLFAELQRADLSPKLPEQKRCHWHVDFLIDQLSVELIAIYGLRTAMPLEPVLADWLATESVTEAIIPGLGASDHHGATHLLRVIAPATWWDALPDRLKKFCIDPNCTPLPMDIYRSEEQ